MAKSDPWPTELKVDKDRRLLTVAFDDGASFALPAELLRVMSPSAEVQGHSPEERVTVPGKKAVRILRLEPVGNYAARIVFDDGHDTGLYAWTYLRELGEHKEERFQSYLAELAAKRLSR
ncbi:gamma-butyrobetaine hydroxylase-like domain-containing protein [Methyloceanibacter sp.]|uniref:gamma-butyrobetaine hydroxylase-like domain-containing protein n=1 Tax=Methyloceanibacter sp. TaxID=1965321 RepID=UPI003D6D0B5B